MPSARVFAELRLVNGSTGDPALFIDYPDRDNALLFDAGDNAALGMEQLADLEAVFVTHHHVDHFIGFDRIVRANLDRDKALYVYGPEGTIRKIYDRIKSYEYSYFPFQKIVLKVHEVLEGRIRSALLECSRRFPEPQIEDAEWKGPVLYDTDDLSVEAVHVDHTVPCLAYALVEKPAIYVERERLAAGPDPAGPWVGEALRLLRSGASGTASVNVQGKPVRLKTLKARYFSDSTGSRVAYVTDTAWSDSVREPLLGLARGASRLYCDSFYSQAQSAQAKKYHHMTATQAAEFARDAGVDALVLIHFAARYAGRYDLLVEEARAIFGRVSAEIPREPSKNEPTPANHS